MVCLDVINDALHGIRASLRLSFSRDIDQDVILRSKSLRILAPPFGLKTMIAFDRSPGRRTSTAAP
jgi:hypothetical protein